MEQLGAAIHRFQDPLEGDGMVLGGIAAHNQDAVTVFQIDVLVGHRTTAKRLSQSRYGGAVSDPGLAIENLAITSA